MTRGVRVQATLFDEADRPQAAAASALDVASTVSRVERLVAAYLDGALGGTTHEVFPDVPLSSRERYLYFTLSPALNYQRKSEGLWRAADATFADPETRFVFYPECTDRPEEEYRVALTKYGLALQPDKQTRIWYTIASTLRSDFDSDPRKVVEQCSGSAKRVKETLQRDKRLWPYLSGPKLSNYWLYMLTCFTDVKLTDRREISVIPDIHVRRATQYLGLVTHLPEAEEAAAIWDGLLSGTELAPCDVHAPLWRWSRSGFRLGV